MLRRAENSAVGVLTRPVLGWCVPAWTVAALALMMALILAACAGEVASTADVCEIAEQADQHH